MASIASTGGERPRKPRRPKISADEQSAILAEIWALLKKHDLSISHFIRLTHLANQRRGS